MQSGKNPVSRQFLTPVIHAFTSGGIASRMIALTAQAELGVETIALKRRQLLPDGAAGT